ATSARGAMRRAVFGSARKCCPRLRRGASPCCASNACTVAGVSIIGAPGTTTRRSPVQLARAAPVRPAVRVVDALTDDDLLFAGGEAGVRCEVEPAEPPPRRPVDPEAAVVRTRVR